MILYEVFVGNDKVYSGVSYTRAMYKYLHSTPDKSDTNTNETRHTHRALMRCTDTDTGKITEVGG